MMFVYDDYKTKIDKVLEQPYLIDRMKGLEDIAGEIDTVLADHDRDQNITTPVELRNFGIGLGLTAVVGAVGFFTVGLGFVITAAFLGGIGSLAAGAVTENNATVKEKAAQKYREKHADELYGLNSLKNILRDHRAYQLKQLREMTPAQQAGVVKLEEIVDSFPETRQILVNAFRQAVDNPVYEQAGVQQEAKSTEATTHSRDVPNQDFNGPE